MKKFFEQLQSYGQKAEQVKQIIAAAPEKAANLRDAVFMTTGQLQAMRRDVQATVAGLRAEDDLRLSTALNDIQAGAEEIRKAGYELAGVEMELDPVQRLILLLEKVDDVTEGEMRSLIAANATRKSLHGVLSALMKGEQMADECRLQGMEFCQLRVSLGPIPSVRLIWRPADHHPAEELATPPAHQPVGAPAPPPLPEKSIFGQGSFFERKPPAPATESPAATMATAHEPAAREAEPATTLPKLIPRAKPATSPAPVEPQSAASGSQESRWGSSTLDRFKKMPDLTRH